MRSFVVIPLLIVLASVELAAQTPQATELPGAPFFIKKTWTIGGEGNWDYLTLDPAALRLYIPHGGAVQVVDVNAGEVIGEITGLHEAHSVALDDRDEFGYISDGPSNEVVVFNRSSLEIVAHVATGKNPRALVFEPVSRQLFAFCSSAPADSSPVTRSPRRPNATQRPVEPSAVSTISVIDTETKTRQADLLISGSLGFAQADGKGRVYVNITDRNEIGQFSFGGIGSKLRELAAEAKAKSDKAAAPSLTDADKSNLSKATPEKANGAGTDSTAGTFPTIDWSDAGHGTAGFASLLRVLHRGQDCQSPKGLAIDNVNERLFAACDNMRMEVLNAENGQVVASLPIGAGTDAIGYDPDRGLIYASNGGGVGSLTIIRQHLTDSYAVIQELPTEARARTLAVNPVSGEVYLVTNIEGFDLSKRGTGGSTHTLPAVKPSAVQGSFRVLVIGN